MALADHIPPEALSMIVENAIEIPEHYDRVAVMVFDEEPTPLFFGKGLPPMYWCYVCQTFHNLHGKFVQ